MEDRISQKQREFAYLKEEYEKHPELFTYGTFIEDAETLRGFGIALPEKEVLPTGVVKLWPEDFIVEEVSPEGSVSTIDQTQDKTPHEEGGTVYATLVKCNLSTLQVIDDLAQALCIRKEQIGFSGIKDKDAITAQRISIRGSSVEIVQKLHSLHFFLKDVRQGKGAIEKGNLKGNRFTILVRTPDSLREGEKAHALSRALRRVHDEGFYNFFYLQRFGTPRLRNFIWARDLLQGKDEAALADFLTTPAERELPYFKHLRTSLKPLLGDWDAVYKAIEPFPSVFEHERKVVDRLRAHPSDIGNAFMAIPDQITMWMYALSSYLFNARISSYLLSGHPVPDTLPFFLSPQTKDRELYTDILQAWGVSSTSLENLKRFPQVQIRRRTAPTKDHAALQKGEVLDEGLLLQFELGKGQYATTLLSHLFNLASGAPPHGIAQNRIDTRAALGLPPVHEVTDVFKDVIHSKTQSQFEMGEE